MAQPENAEWLNYSIELCGGTHIKSTAVVKQFVIVSETGIAKGVRRIIAWTGDAVKTLFVNVDEIRKKIAAAKSEQGETLAQLISTISQDVDSVALPAIIRPIFQSEIEQLVALKQSDKKNTTATVVQQAEEYLTKAKASNAKFIVEEIAASNDQKALSAAMQVFKNKIQMPVALVSK